MDRGHPPRRWPLVSLLTALTYNTWVLTGPLNGHLELFDGYLSELSASDQRNNLFFRVGDNVTSLIVGAIGMLALLTWPRRYPTRRRWWWVLGGALVLFAVSTFLDSFFSMDCSPTLSRTCRVLEETGQLSTVHYAHTYTSVGAQTGIVASMVAAYIAMVRSGAGRRRWQRVVLAVAVTEVAALTVMMVMLAAGVPGIGYPQAVMVAVASLWFAGLGPALLRPPPAAPAVAPVKEDEHAR